MDTDECDRPRLQRFVEWVQEREKKGEIVKLAGVGDYSDFLSPSGRRKLVSADFYDSSRTSIEQMMWDRCKEMGDFFEPIKRCFLFLLTGHHVYKFGIQKLSGRWLGRTSDEWLAHRLGCDYAGDGVCLFRLQFPHALSLDVLAYHGSGGAQTLGGRVQKRARFAEIAPTAHAVMTGHDNAKLAVPRSGLDFDHGHIKRYLIGTGSFQRAYLEGTEAGYAERAGLVPADLGVTIMDIEIEQRRGQWRVDFHASV